MVKQCLFCGRYFTPDVRVGRRQKACFRQECKKARKESAQRSWCDNNPGYFTGRYPYVKAWREKRMIQDEIPRKEPYRKLIFLIPKTLMPMIQDAILVKRCGKRTFAAHGYG